MSKESFKTIMPDHENGTNGAVADPPLLFKLILAQLVHEKGEDAFPDIVKDLKEHTLLKGMDERNMSVPVSLLSIGMTTQY